MPENTLENSVVDIVHSVLINPSFLGVLFGSLLSIAGIWITNNANDRRQRTQFLHDLKQKKSDREMILRKEVFLAATEALSAGTICIYNFCDIDMPNDQVTKSYLDKIPALSKVHLIADIDTVKALLSHSSAIDSIFFSLWMKRHQLIAIKVQIETLQAQIDNALKEQLTINLMIRDEQLQGFEGVLDFV